MCAHPALPPPAPAPPTRTCTRSFAGHRDQVRPARAFLARFLDGMARADDAVLLISELAANACAHTASGQTSGTFTVRAEICPGLCAHVEVEDQGSGWDGDIGAAESPHGLFLLRELADDCGTRRGTHGWVTWFTIARPQQAAPS